MRPISLVPAAVLLLAVVAPAPAADPLVLDIDFAVHHDVSPPLREIPPPPLKPRVRRLIPNQRYDWLVHLRPLMEDPLVASF